MLVCLCCAEKKIINKCKRCWRNLESIIIVILSMHERHRAHVGTNDNLQIVIVAVCSNDNLQIFYHSRVQQKQFHRLRRRCVLLSVPSRCCSSSIFLPSLLQLCFYCCCCFVDRQQNCFIAVGCMFSISPNKWSLCNNLWINKCSVEKLSNFFFCLFIYNHLHNNLQGMLLINV